MPEIKKNILFFFISCLHKIEILPLEMNLKFLNKNDSQTLNINGGDIFKIVKSLSIVNRF